jgi:hypothetical protein
MHQIVAQEHSNPLVPSAHVRKDFLFCPTGCDLARLEAKARASLVLDDTPRRSASFASGLAQILRRRHKHVAHCSSCILREVFDGGLPQ